MNEHTNDLCECGSQWVMELVSKCACEEASKYACVRLCEFALCVYLACMHVQCVSKETNK